MGRWSDASLSVDEAILVAEYNDECDDILSVYARASRGCTTDRPQDAPTPGWDS